MQGFQPGYIQKRGCQAVLQGICSVAIDMVLAKPELKIDIAFSPTEQARELLCHRTTACWRQIWVLPTRPQQHIVTEWDHGIAVFVSYMGIFALD
jgi:hypothetical protein